MGASLNNPLGNTDVNQYGGHVTGNLGTINNSPGIINPHIQAGGNLPSTVEDLQGTYNYDINDIVIARHRDKFPTLAIADLNASPWNSVVYPFSEDFDGDFQFPEMLLDDLRTSEPTIYAIGNASETGGKMQWFKAVPTDTTTILAARTGTAASGTMVTAGAGSWAGALDEVAMISYSPNGGTAQKCIALGFELGAGETILGGTARNFITKMSALLAGMRYTQVGGSGGVASPVSEIGGNDWYGWCHDDATAKTVHIMFPDIALDIAASEYQEHEIVVRLQDFWFDATATQFILILNFDKSNLDSTLNATASNNTVLLEEMYVNASTFTAGFTRMDHQALLGMYNTVPAGIQEGGSATSNYQTGFQYAFQSKENYMQIFRADPMEVTGSRIASGNYRIDDVQRNRDKMLFLYKKDKANAMIWGKKSRTMGDNGRDTRTMSGIFDYELTPIRYIRATLDHTTATTAVLSAFLDKIAYSLNSFKPRAGNDVTSMMCSHLMLRKLDEVVKLSYGTTPNLHGYGTQQPYQPNNVDFGIAHFDFKTSYGTLRFMHEPMLDFMTEFQLPAFLTGVNVNPKYVMLALDKQYIKTKTLRGDKLQGNIQAADEDLSREDIIGEHTLEMLYPKNHAVILTTII